LEANQATELRKIVEELAQPARLDEMPRRVELCCRALELVERERNPELWAALQMELANSLAQSPSGNRTENLERAIASYEAALEVRTREAMPVAWALTQINLAYAYSQRIRGDRAENLERAIAGYEAVLEVLTREGMQAEVHETQMNLANAYLQRIRGDRAETRREYERFEQLRRADHDAISELLAQAEALFQEAEQPRYTDLTIYEGRLFSSADLDGAIRLADAQPLVIGRPYTLEVAIRLQRRGIDAQRRAPSVENPRHDKEDLTVYVLVRPKWPAIEVNESFKQVKWPYNEDSESALFPLEVRSVSSAFMQSGDIEVRLFDGNLDLLDIVELFLVTVPEESQQPVPAVPGQQLSWPARKSGVPLIDPNSPLRSLSIDISFDNASLTYNFLFKFLRKSGEEVQIPGSSTLTLGELERLLVKIRNFWTELVITNYAAALSVSGPTFSKYLVQLRELGTEAWSLLFGTRYAARKGASETIGDLLARMQLDEGTHIQIVHGRLRDFIFPWSILYPRNPATANQEPVDPFQFWGARFKIEQVTEGPTRNMLDDVPIGVIFALDQGFANAELQQELLLDYQAAARGRLLVTNPITDQATLFAQLVRNP